jgi:oxygen-independent coproporphyrinogen-3 oxidase
MHLYIHVPFCGRRCSYCDFAIAVRRNVPSAQYVARVLKEWDTWEEHPAWSDSPTLDTVYFGGGTPSLLGPELIGKLLEAVGRSRGIVSGAEITLEANPDDVDSRRAASWRV